MVNLVSTSVEQCNLSRWLQTPADNSYEAAVQQSRTRPLEPLPAAVLAHVVALSDALDADRAARSSAVHLVIVEQTLKQRIFGGLDSIPVPVLRHAAAQLPRLSSFRSSPELQLLLKCMRGSIEDHNLPILRTVLHPVAEVKSVSKPVDVRGKEDDASEDWRSDTPLRPAQAWQDSEPECHDDGFPDTCSPDECDVPVPMPPMDRGAAAAKIDEKWR